MKNLLMFISLIFSLSFFSIQKASANERENIALIGQAQHERPRSVFPVQAWRIGTDVYVSFMNAPKEVVISIKDENGTVVAEKVLVLPEVVQIPVINGAGNYTVEVSYEDTYLIGDFSL